MKTLCTITWMEDILHNVDIQRSWISQIPQPSFIGHHWRRGPVFLPVSWLRQVNLFKFYRVSCGLLQHAIVIFGLSIEFNFRSLLDNFLDGHLDEFVKRVELLPHESLLIKIGADHHPTGFLPVLGCDFIINRMGRFCARRKINLLLLCNSNV